MCFIDKVHFRPLGRISIPSLDTYKTLRTPFLLPRPSAAVTWTLIAVHVFTQECWPFGWIVLLSVLGEETAPFGRSVTRNKILHPFPKFGLKIRSLLIHTFANIAFS